MTNVTDLPLFSQPSFTEPIAAQQEAPVDSSLPWIHVWESGKKRRVFQHACAWCGKVFYARKYSVKGRVRGKFCSRECLGKHSAHDIHHGMSGEHNPSWKGGVSKDNMRYKNRFQSQNPEKVAVHKEICNALRRGALTRGPCEVCGTTEKIQAHHDDYTKPYAIRWLCRTHHVELHHKGKKYAKWSPAIEAVPIG